jgi:hypothetical protein
MDNNKKIKDNFYNFQTLNTYALKNFERMNTLDEKCNNLESIYLSKIINRINEKISILEENLKDSFDLKTNNNSYDEDRIKKIENALNSLEKEFDALEMNTTNDLNYNIADKINKKIEENYKILGDIEKLTNNKFINKINYQFMENIESNSTSEEFSSANFEKNENWIEDDWNKIADKKEPLNAVNFTESFKQEIIKDKLQEIDDRIRLITTKEKPGTSQGLENRKDGLLKKLILTEKRIEELKLNLSK